MFLTSCDCGSHAWNKNIFHWNPTTGVDGAVWAIFDVRMNWHPEKLGKPINITLPSQRPKYDDFIYQGNCLLLLIEQCPHFWFPHLKKCNAHKRCSKTIWSTIWKFRLSVLLATKLWASIPFKNHTKAAI